MGIADDAVADVVFGVRLLLLMIIRLIFILIIINRLRELLLLILFLIVIDFIFTGSQFILSFHCVNLVAIKQPINIIQTVVNLIKVDRLLV